MSVTGRAHDLWHEGHEPLALVVGEDVVQGAAEGAEDGGGALWVVAEFFAGDVGDGFEEADAVVDVGVSAAGEGGDLGQSFVDDAHRNAFRGWVVGACGVGEVALPRAGWLWIRPGVALLAETPRFEFLGEEGLRRRLGPGTVDGGLGARGRRRRP